MAMLLGLPKDLTQRELSNLTIIKKLIDNHGQAPILTHMKIISLEKATNILQLSQAVIIDGMATFGSTSDNEDEPFFEECPSDVSLGREIRLWKENNQNVLVDGPKLIFLNKKGESVYITPLFEKVLE